MNSKFLVRPLLLLLCLAAVLSVPPSLLAARERRDEKTAGGSKDATDGSDKKEKKWDVSNPPGDWKDVSIETDETTWSDVDVSPDGRTIVFDMLGDLYRVPIEGGEAVSLASGIPWDFQARFSPDGSKIAFISDRGGADNLWVMNADGSSPRALSEEKEHLVHNPSWSPDGQYIVAKKDFTSTRSIPAGEIWLFSLGGGEGLPLVERPLGKKDQKNIAEPAFSRDGRYVYYSQDTTEGPRWQYNKDSTGVIFTIRRLDRQTGEVEDFIARPGGAIRPTPSPDGKYLAFVRRTPAFTSALYVKELASGLETPIYDRLDRDLQEADGCQGNTPAFAWTPDSRDIVFWAGGKIRRVNLATRQASVIPVRIRTTRKIHAALRTPVEVAPDTFDVRMLRWVRRSPDGRRVAFQALGHVYVQDLPGGARRRLTKADDEFEFYPAFSPDGRSIVYTTWNDERLGRVRIAPVDGGDSRVVTPDPGVYVEPQFSPDGALVVYRKATGGYLLSGAWSVDPGIYVVAAAGGTPRRVSRGGGSPQFGPAGAASGSTASGSNASGAEAAGAGASGGGGAPRPRWRIYFSDTVEDTVLAFRSVTLDGLDERTHLKGAEATEFSLSPDGRWIAFTEQNNAFIAPFTLTGKTVDIGSQAKSLPVKQVSKRAGENLHWSGDGTSLHWAHGPVLYGRDLKDAFAFLAGAPEKLPEPVETGVDLSFKANGDTPGGLIALVGGRVVTMRDAGRTQEVIENGVVLVRGKRIEAVGTRAEVRVPADAKVFDATGKTIIPGLVDVHAHGAQGEEGITPQQNWGQFSELAFGVTTIHDPSNDSSEIFSAAELQRAGAILGPHIYSTGTILYGAHSPGVTAKIDSLDDALFHVRRLKEMGAISVKSYQQPRRDQRQQIIEAARQLGMMVVPEGGSKFEHNMSEIADGHTGIEHAIPLVNAYEDVRQFWSASGSGWTPTFVVAYGGLSGENYWYQHDDVWKDERLMRYSPRFVIEPRSMRRTMAPDEHQNAIYVARLAKALRDRGVSIQIGAHGQREGLAAHWEMWTMVKGGFTPWEAIRAATIDGARYVGLDRSIGSLEPGKIADLSVIDGDPLTDIRRSEFVAWTMENGRLYEAATMRQLAPDPKERKPFFWEKEGGDTVHPATWKWLEEKRQRLGWDD